MARVQRGKTALGGPVGPHRDVLESLTGKLPAAFTGIPVPPSGEIPEASGKNETGETAGGLRGFPEDQPTRDGPAPEPQNVRGMERARRPPGPVTGYPAPSA